MVLMSLEFTVAGIICGICTIYYVLRRFNSWWYEPTLNKGSAPLPPGDMGWPLLGNMLTFLRAFESSNPEAFILSFASRFNRVGLYKAFMFGNPTILATSPEACNLVMMDDTHFVPGWPRSTVDLMGRKSFVAINFDEHKRLRKLTAAPVSGPEVLSKYLNWIEDIKVLALENWSKMDKVDFLKEIRKLTFEIVAYIFVWLWQSICRGTAYWKALKARKKLVTILQSIIDKRRAGQEKLVDKKADMLDELLKVKDQNGRFMEDEEIIDLLIMYLNAGHESSGHMTMWIVLLLLKHPEIYAKCKEEQEKIVRSRPEGRKHLIYSELKEMKYLHKVINESLRLVSFSAMVFREALEDVELIGYTIPKGWKVQVWLRNVHLDPEVYPHPQKFDPDRWDNLLPRPGMFVPFGVGSRLCPGNELAKMEMCVFMHCFLLHYEVQRLTPECKLRYLPHTRPIDDCPVKIRKLKPSQQV
ncbi:hypothetical protein SUGI_0197120 [Cryptomeria japonica]|nr:hypothetical protein SUGI_0197120 [Cryptomeria japonica]